MDLDWFLEEYDFLQAILDETEDDWIWEKAEKKFKDVWSIIHSGDPMHPTVARGAPWHDPSWLAPSKRPKKSKAVPLPGSVHIGMGAPLTGDDDDEKTDPGGWPIDPWFNRSKDKASPADLDLDLSLDDEKPKSEGDKMMDFFFK